MKKHYKTILFINNLLILSLLGCDWFFNTEFSFETYESSSSKGIDVMLNNYGLYLIIYIACMLIYLISIIRNRYLPLYIIDITLIITFTIYPLGVFGGIGAAIENPAMVKTIYGDLLAIGYFLAVLLLILNMILLTYFRPKIKNYFCHQM